MNPLLSKAVRLRIPNYSYARLANFSDVKKAFPSFDASQTVDFLNTSFDTSLLKDLKRVKPIQDQNFLKIVKTTKERTNSLMSAYRRGCSPWLSKEKPLSVIKCQKNPLKGKIYACISARHSAEDDYVVVQETENIFGYSPPVFSAKATVAFPPILKGEVWTVGWIQAMKKSDRSIYHNLKEL